MSDEPQIIARFNDTAGLKDALRKRITELAISFDIVDEMCNFPLRYSSKLLAPSNMKNLGPMSFESLLGELAVELHMVENPAAMERTLRRIDKSTTGRPRRPSVLTAGEQAVIQFKLTRRHMKKLANLATIGRKRIPRWKRRQIARKAARAMHRKKRLEREGAIICPISDTPAFQPTGKALKTSKSG